VAARTRSRRRQTRAGTVVSTGGAGEDGERGHRSVRAHMPTRASRIAVLPVGYAEVPTRVSSGAECC
jgi:hypothetical protein